MTEKRKIGAIETEYNEYLFRSRLEARWAVFLGELGIEYEYEKEGYHLGENGMYLPDFWLPDVYMRAPKEGGDYSLKEPGVWLEIKGQRPTEEEEAKASALGELTGKGVIIWTGGPNNPDERGNFNQHVYQEYPLYDNYMTLYKCSCGCFKFDFMSDQHECPRCARGWSEEGTKEILLAARKAKQARFDYKRV